MKKKIKASNINIKLYQLISDAVEEGIAGGYNKACKWALDGEPTEESLKEQIHHYIMLELDEVIDFER